MHALQFRELAHQVVDWIADYYKRLDTLETMKPNIKVLAKHSESVFAATQPL